MSLSVLFVGGTGEISWACVHEAVRKGFDVTVLNRGRSGERLPLQVKHIDCDFSDDAAYRAAVEQGFDIVCQFLVFHPEQLQRDIDVFRDKVGQYVFISTASAYAKPVSRVPIVETTPLVNPYWEYSRRKAACEQLLQAEKALPYTIVRPSHTIRKRFPTAMSEGDTALHRMLANKPIIVPGDGAALWTLTRSEDFAVPFVRLFGKSAAINRDFHITSDHAWPWDMIYTTIGSLLGVQVDLVHVPTDTLVRFREEWRGPLLGDRAYSVMFDNSKVKSVVGDFTCEPDLSKMLRSPFEHLLDKGGPSGLQPSEELGALFDRLVAAQRRVKPKVHAL
ncbi:NAD-dependent epimerase/dehydratase family protein [Hoeflea sp. WL0058]|uniref:UDP-glucose 4-epimerase n=1 Tax=Flavimaribacter sediminis TaxID=2865987 RepID=A0AAE2ZS36_9HYPH|nr:NAD-dependent epimerase/dehydratase family protein [Flavimaribacter sediminis]